MKTITEIIRPITLLKGPHEDTGQTGQGSFMNVVAYLNGEAQITDHSECVCVTIKPIAIWLNDHLQDNERAQMVPFIGRAMGSATTDKIEINRRLALVVTFAQKMRNVSTLSTLSTLSTQCAAECARYAAEYAQSAAEYAANHARYAAEYAANHARYAAEYAANHARYAAQSAAKYAKYAARCAAECARYAAEYAAEYAAQSAANHAAEYARYTAEYTAEYARYAAEYAESFIKYTEIRQQIINAAFEYLDAALPKRECTNSAVLKRAEKLAEML